MLNKCSKILKEEVSWKEPITKIKNEALQKTSKISLFKEKNRDSSNVVFTVESSFLFISTRVSRWVLWGKNNIVVKEKYSKKCMYGDHIETWEQSV